MSDPFQNDPVIQQLINWGQERSSVRAMVLTSSRTNPHAPVDLFSDYDVILAVTDIQPFFDDRAWLEDFGEVLVVYRDPIKLRLGIGRFAYITQYADGLKIDFTLWPVGLMQQVAASPELPGDLDIGYAVLLDKDDLTSGLQPPTHTAFIPSPPTEAEYGTVIEEFFHEATYVAKYLWRDDLMSAKYILDSGLRVDNLRQMLEWRIEIEHNWSVKPGDYGRGLKKLLSPEIWSALESTYVGAGIEENWEAMFRMVDLFRLVAEQVGEQLGHEYPLELHRRAVDYLEKVQGLDREAESFSS
jgi:aminoglycoside 6-adenylyltransferase